MALPVKQRFAYGRLKLGHAPAQSRLAQFQHAGRAAQAALLMHRQKQFQIIPSQIHIYPPE
jgi:hypothetical protein